jgi:hypothetical protein
MSKYSLIGVLILALMIVPVSMAYAKDQSPPPSTPESYAPVVNADGSITFTWSSVNITPDVDNDRYVVEWGTSSPYASVAVYTTSYTTPADLPSGSYDFKVKAGDFDRSEQPNTVWSDWSTVVSASVAEVDALLSDPLSIVAPEDIKVEGNTIGGAIGVVIGDPSVSGGGCTIHRCE